MLALRGIYNNGIVQLEKEIKNKEDIQVIVTFLQDPTETKHSNETLLEKLKSGPQMSDDQYKDYVSSKNWFNESRLIK